jgi:hypothetical protein
MSLRTRIDVTGETPGEHTVGLRVVDRSGNSVLRATRVTLPAPR